MAARVSRVLRATAARTVVQNASLNSAMIQVRNISTSRPVFAKEFVGEGLETDPFRGVRINQEKFNALKGVPRSPEYSNALEQDPFGHIEGSGANDDIFGEWGLDRDAPHISTGQAGFMFVVAISGLCCFYTVAKTYSAGIVSPVAPREGLWTVEAAKH
mmetsp:Transcript_15078/g.41175  ORF Transcript_15078/g.41175 Transcript_15078/m.41175 type:complete len:159 (-) Transcript_15078:112-588(-)